MPLDLAKIQVKLLQNLDSMYGQTTPDLMPYVADNLEEYLIDFFEQSLSEGLSSVEVLHGTPRIGKFLRLGQDLYHIKVADDVSQKNTLAVVLKRYVHNEDHQRLKRFTAKIDGCGTYQKVNLLLPEEVSDKADEFVNLATIIFSIGYVWLLEYIQKSLRQTEDEFVFALRSRLRRLFSIDGKGDLADQVWLAMVDKDRGFYVVDQKQGNTAISMLQRYLTKIPDSPAILISEFLTTSIPFEIMNAKLAIEENTHIQIKLDHSKYLDQETRFSVAQKVIHNTDFISIHPIVTEGKQFLFAVFSSEYQNDIIPLMEKASTDLIEIFTFSKNRTLRIVNRLETGVRQSLSIGKVGEFTGGLIRGFLDLNT